jgi:hypothetical protein
MKQIAGLLFGIVVLVLVGLASLAVARVEARMADAQQNMETFQYEAAQENLDAAEGYLGYGQMAAIGTETEAEVRARRASLLYWQQQYDALLPSQPEPVTTVDETNVELQLVVANAAYRAGQAKAADREAMLRMLDDSAAGYLTVLKNQTWHPNAAFNYEYVLRLRNEIAKGRKPVTEGPGDAELGESGGPAPATKLGGFQIYVPKQSDERSPEGGEAGQGEPRQRKG